MGERKERERTGGVMTSALDFAYQKKCTRFGLEKWRQCSVIGEWPLLLPTYIPQDDKNQPDVLIIPLFRFPMSP